MTVQLNNLVQQSTKRQAKKIFFFKDWLDIGFLSPGATVGRLSAKDTQSFMSILTGHEEELHGEC